MNMKSGEIIEQEIGRHHSNLIHIAFVGLPKQAK